MKFSLKKKAILIVFLIALLISIMSVLVSYMVYSDNMDEHYAMLAENVAGTSSKMVDMKEVQKLTQQVMDIYREQCVNGQAPDFDSFSDVEWENYYGCFSEVVESPEYASVFETLSTIKKENNVLWMYICYMDERTGKAVYIIDADDPGEANRTGYCDGIEKDNLELMKKGDYNFPAYFTNYDEYGWLCTASVPVLDDNGDVIANAYVDISMEKVVQDRKTFLIKLIFVLWVVTVALTILLYFGVNKTAVQPINLLAKATECFVSDQKNKEGQSAISAIEVKTGDEIENLCNSIKKMESDIYTYINELTSVTAEKERIGAELDVARNIQATVLPCIFPAFPERNEFDIYASMKPAKEVGGDFYDFFLLDPDHLVLVIADVSGKGVPAAMFMMISKTLIKSAVQIGLTPGAVLEKVNNQLCENNDVEMFVTVWLGILEISTGKMVCANAGHEYPTIKRAGGSFELLKDKHGLVVGGMENVRYREYEIMLQKGDIIFVYTDGVPEATSSQNELFGTKRMVDALNIDKNADCVTLIDNVRNEVEKFVGDAPQFDDMTMLSLIYER